jgi:hypothetical protein
MINKLGLDYFIEDNFDIVDYLGRETKAKVLWVYNFMDRNYQYKNKFPTLRKALEKVVQENGLRV